MQRPLQGAFLTLKGVKQGETNFPPSWQADCTLTEKSSWTYFAQLMSHCRRSYSEYKHILCKRKTFTVYSMKDSSLKCVCTSNESHMRFFHDQQMWVYVWLLLKNLANCKLMDILLYCIRLPVTVHIRRQAILDSRFYRKEKSGGKLYCGGLWLWLYTLQTSKNQGKGVR